MASNFRVEHINFYVADFNTAYHAILGQPTLAKFMAIPHYAYLSLSLTEATDLSIQMASVVTDAKTVPADDLEIPALEPPRAYAKSKEMKEVGLGLDDPTKTVKIGAHLDPK
ncbi:uncharacterized protein [Miscanthus floridulus]|uniref:uncharacterized protein n=1 Tax=Miscanthus floridulus TaxID=154761 RepID=UPI00345A303A